MLPRRGSAPGLLTGRTGCGGLPAVDGGVAMPRGDGDAVQLRAAPQVAAKRVQRPARSRAVQMYGARQRLDACTHAGACHYDRLQETITQPNLPIIIIRRPSTARHVRHACMHAGNRAHLPSCTWMACRRACASGASAGGARAAAAAQLPSRAASCVSALLIRSVTQGRVVAGGGHEHADDAQSHISPHNRGKQPSGTDVLKLQ